MDTERLKPEELDVHVENGTFRLAFVGMSNAGKSYRSRVLQNEMDFFWYEVDAHIQKQLGFSDMDDISAWLSVPTSPTYAERQRLYLEAEEQCTHLQNLDTGGRNLVFDTTGSVIYLSQETKGWLHDECLTVNIDVNEEYIEKMITKFLDHPKPVIWGDLYQPLKGESEMDTLKRCYPQLLEYRLQQYRDFAHLSVPLTELYDTSAEETLNIIKRYL